MKYFCSTDLAYLNELNTRGLSLFASDGKPNSTTQYVDIIKHPNRAEWAACIPENYQEIFGNVLTPDETAAIATAVKTHEQMNADGWFPIVVLP